MTVAKVVGHLLNERMNAWISERRSLLDLDLGWHPNVWTPFSIKLYPLKIGHNIYIIREETNLELLQIEFGLVAQNSVAGHASGPLEWKEGEKKFRM